MIPIAERGELSLQPQRETLLAFRIRPSLDDFLHVGLGQLSAGEQILERFTSVQSGFDGFIHTAQRIQLVLRIEIVAQQKVSNHLNGDFLWMLQQVLVQPLLNLHRYSAAIHRQGIQLVEHLKPLVTQRRFGQHVRVRQIGAGVGHTIDKRLLTGLKVHLFVDVPGVNRPFRFTANPRESVMSRIQRSNEIGHSEFKDSFYFLRRGNAVFGLVQKRQIARSVVQNSLQFHPIHLIRNHAVIRVHLLGTEQIVLCPFHQRGKPLRIGIFHRNTRQHRAHVFTKLFLPAAVSFGIRLVIHFALGG